MSQVSSPNIAQRPSGESILRDQDRVQRSPSASAILTISKIGWWSALLTSICGVCYGMAVIAVMVSSLASQSASAAQGWTGIDAFLASFTPLQMLPVIPSLFLAPAFTALMVSIHSYAAEDKKIWSRLGMAFTLIYASMAAMNYMI